MHRWIFMLQKIDSGQAKVNAFNSTWGYISHKTGIQKWYIWVSCSCKYARNVEYAHWTLFAVGKHVPCFPWIQSKPFPHVALLWCGVSHLRHQSGLRQGHSWWYPCCGFYTPPSFQPTTFEYYWSGGNSHNGMGCSPGGNYVQVKVGVLWWGYQSLETDVTWSSV